MSSIETPCKICNERHVDDWVACLEVRVAQLTDQAHRYFTALKKIQTSGVLKEGYTEKQLSGAYLRVLNIANKALLDTAVQQANVSEGK